MLALSLLSSKEMTPTMNLIHPFLFYGYDVDDKYCAPFSPGNDINDNSQIVPFRALAILTPTIEAGQTPTYRLLRYPKCCALVAYIATGFKGRVFCVGVLLHPS